MRTLFTGFAFLGALTGAAGCTRADDGNAGASTSTYMILDDQGSRLRDDFNRSKGTVRLLFVVDPTCGGCLRGMDDVNRDLLAITDDPRLRIFVVHVPVIGATEKDVSPATKLLRNPHVHHYWNASGAFGRELAEAVGLKRGDELVYAWDVWLIYGPEATWEGVSPPRPRRLMHQLRALQGSKDFPRLDSEVFAREVNELLAMPPAASSTP